ncbi:hypothetical protein LLH06_10105 [Mucilaginibacter daejeonensis]|uniref:hypothetical protein n=1 Tax=Mucilaginibacter daejeonensis TaxID=398049 RepID=UPI001D17C697|nr:hypothetical protein [Mucilaginibacter daejeonensis]UEG55312.1 hypothetical protein LLH06_10105 [Mucilaginibacter daejeonensis]
MPTESIYFKFRDRLNFSPHEFEVGRPIFQNRELEDNFFFLKIYQLEEKKFAGLYNFHLAYFSEKHPNKEQEFFDHVLYAINTRIDHFRRQEPIRPAYARNMASAKKLERFKVFLKTIDRWHKLEPIESVIAEKDREIDRLTGLLAKSEADLKEARMYDAAEKINITKGGLAAFMDLIKKIQVLTFDENGKLVNAQTQSPWYKMIAKYFKHGDKDISIDTARNYFPATKGDKPPKFIEITEKDKRYTIIAKGKQ